MRSKINSNAPLHLMFITNVLVQWQVTIGVFTVTYALFIYPLTFLLTDYTSEVYGKRASTHLVWAGFLASLIPSLLMSTLQICIGSLLAYIIAQFHDIWAFHWWKRKTGGKYLWLRNNASAMTSQLIDTVIFATVAFYGVLHSKTILKIIFSEYPIKVLYAAMDTGPLCLLVLKHKKSNRNNE